MKKVGIQFYNLNNYFPGGCFHGGGAVAMLSILLSLSENPEIDLYIFTTIPYEGEINNAKIINGIEKKEDIEEYIQKEGIELMISGAAQNIRKAVFLHAHSALFKINRVLPIFRPIKALLSIKEIKKENNYYHSEVNYSSQTFFVAPSKKIKEDYQKNYKIAENRILLNYFGCPQVYEKLPEIKQHEKITFGIIAGSSLNKGGYFTLFVMGLLKLSGYDFNLKIILKRPKTDLFANLLIIICNLKSNVEKHGKYKDMSKFYPQIDCLLMASFNEAFGLVVTEAMAYGKPCIVSDTTGVAEIIDPKNGVVFKRTILGYLKGLKRMINLYNSDIEGFKSLGANAYEFSKTQTWEKCSQRLIDYNPDDAAAAQVFN